MVKCVLRYANIETLLAKLSKIGVAVKPLYTVVGQVTDDDGKTVDVVNPTPIENVVGRVCTPELIAKNLDHVITIVLAKEEAALLPDVSSPDFLTDWRSDEVVEVIGEDGKTATELLPWPEYEIPAPEGWPTETVSEDGKTTTPCVYKQYAGRIV